ncbi:hypothetical protein [Oceanobacillus sp. CFH 90083]|uniref:sunset domain-containing protein n=1 Tax=Oceanobacillus sp. CFH 90083 TaxID=2592336 RepID=UPI00128D2807|nr:hypothetical protein [Oceanobacillus sp. CFH 90083]
MGTLLVISMILVLSGLAIYTLSHSTSNRKIKKTYLPALALAMVLTVLSGCGTDTNTADLDQEIENNEELTSEIAELEKANSSLQAEYDELQSQFNELEEEVTQLKEENETLEDYESIKEENESLAEEIAALKEENEKQEDYESVKEENESLAEEIDTLKENNSELQQQLEDSQEASSSGSSTSSTSEEDDTTASSSQSAEGECNIKGSTSGIYHVPGSTYYDRTTNVVSWFCSEEEAQEAGYRAPKN